ncbi:MAG: hypothetical protein QGH39_09040 [Candidatus Thermoplasmatota archaeon]|jgi:RecJ-like exonuclease|nr:hypothetical protein [Candidatus Thermoplasmatota archaeon]MDP7265686.1 hypothetical protein [Candidatus Thermoplasmatota archaeon]
MGLCLDHGVYSGASCPLCSKGTKGGQTICQYCQGQGYHIISEPTEHTARTDDGIRIPCSSCDGKGFVTYE